MKQWVQNHKLGLIAAVVVLLFAGLLISLLREGDTPSGVNTEKLIQFDGSELAEQRDGRLVWHLTADKILVDPDTGKVYFIKPKGIFIAEDGTELTITADQGIVDRKDKVIEIKAPLDAVTNRGDSLQTDGSVYYNMDTREITGGKVMIKRADSAELSADTFATDAALDKVSLTGHARITKGE